MAALFRAADEAEQITRTAPLTGEPGGHIQILSIRHIRPDPLQARRILPPAVRAGFIQGNLTPAAALLAWREMAEDDPREAKLLESQVITLAASIREQELVNPITVCRDGRGNYLLETGERRWWAHWWLVCVEELSAFDGIRAQVLPAASPARQAAENLQDSPLTAVEEACQIARLLLHLTERDNDHVVAILSGEHSAPSVLVGYGTYRTALDLQRREVYGKWPIVAQVMGRSERQLHRQLAVLNLADEALILADRAGLTEGQLRSLVEVADETEPARQLRIVDLAVEYELPGSEVARLVGTANLDRAEERLERQRRRREKQTDEEPAEPAARRGRSTILVDHLRKLRRSTVSYQKGGFELDDLVNEIVDTGQPDVVQQELTELADYLLRLRDRLALQMRGSQY
jgi:ParB-like chromosome segregation protein Spo0J